MIKAGFPMGARTARAFRCNHEMENIVFFKQLGHLPDIISRRASVNGNAAAIAQKPADRPDKYGVFDKHAHMQIKGKNQRQKQAEIPI